MGKFLTFTIRGRPKAYFPYSKIGINGLEFHNAPIFNNPKTLPSYLALSYSLKYIISNNYKSAVITLLILPIINILYIALITPIAFLFVIYLFLNRLITKQAGPVRSFLKIPFLRHIAPGQDQRIFSFDPPGRYLNGL